MRMSLYEPMDQEPERTRGPSFAVPDADVAIRLTLLTRYMYPEARGSALPGLTIPSPAALRLAAFRQAREDRQRGYRVLPCPGMVK